MNRSTWKLACALVCAALLLSLGVSHSSAQTTTPAKPAQVEGTYDGDITADGQSPLTFKLIVKKDGDKLTAESKDGGDIAIVAIKVDGENVTLTATYQGNPFELPGKVSESGMGGKWEAGGYTGTWSAKRTKS